MTLGHLSSVGSKADAGGRESQPGYPDPPERGSGAHCDLDGQLGALEVGWREGDLRAIGGHVKAIDEDPDDRRFSSIEGGIDVGVGEGAVAGADGLDVVGLEVAQLQLAVGAGPEVDSHLRPDWRGEVELEGDLGVGQRDGVDCEARGREGADGEVLQGWISGGVPRASTGAEEKVCGKL